MEEPPKRRIYGKSRPLDTPKIALPAPYDVPNSPHLDDQPYEPTTDEEFAPEVSQGPKKLFGGETGNNVVGVVGEKTGEKTEKTGGKNPKIPENLGKILDQKRVKKRKKRAEKIPKFRENLGKILDQKPG